MGVGEIGLLFGVMFAGGALGKLLCGPLGDRFGGFAVVLATETTTALALCGLAWGPTGAAIGLALVLGFGLNGTSSVLYAAVATFVPHTSHGAGLRGVLHHDPVRRGRRRARVRAPGRPRWPGLDVRGDGRAHVCGRAAGDAHPPPAGGHLTPPDALSSEAAIGDVVRGVIGARAAVRVTEWHVRQANYVVVAVETEHPDTPPHRQAGGRQANGRTATSTPMAAIAQLVRSQTAVPTFDVVAVDVTRQRWPWAYLIVTQIAGTTWMQLYPRLEADARAVAQRQIGRAAGQLHALRFDAFGQLDGAGSVMHGTTVVPALAQRARRRLTTPRYLARFLELLDVHRDRFADLVTPTLCHEDLNPNNLVFAMRDGRPELAGILDFESAWASTGESDLARLELWWMSAGAAVREGYLEVAPLAAGYAARRPLLQLLWCLEYAQVHNGADDQAVLHQVCDALAIARID